MGGVSAVTDFVDDTVGGVVDAAGDVVQGTFDVVNDAGSSVDDFVNNEIPGGWVTVGLAAGAAGAFDGLLGGEAAAGAESAISPDVIAAANATEDPIAALNALEGWTYSDADYLASIGAGSDIIDAGLNANEALDAAGSGAAATTGGWLDDYSDFLLGAGVGLLGSEALGGGLFGGGGKTGGTGTSSSGGLVPPVKPINGTVPKFSDWEYANAPDFNFEFSDVPVDYFETSQFMPNDAKFIGAQPNMEYSSALIQALQNASAGPASNNNGFTMYQAKAK